MFRAQFSALTEPELKGVEIEFNKNNTEVQLLSGAFNNLGRPDKLQAQSVDVRQECFGCPVFVVGCKFWKNIADCNNFMNWSSKTHQINSSS